MRIDEWQFWQVFVLVLLLLAAFFERCLYGRLRDWSGRRFAPSDASIESEEDASRISVHFPDEVRVTDEDRWPELLEWMVDTIERVKAALDQSSRVWGQSQPTCSTTM